MPKISGKELGVALLLVVLCTFLSIKNPQFLSIENLQNTSRLIGMFGIFSLGISFIIITGGIDVSVGSLIALLGVLFAMGTMEYHWNPYFVAVGVLVIGALVGLLHGLLVTKAKMQPFIVTLCGLFLYRGIARFVATDETKGLGTDLDLPQLKMLVKPVFGVPMPFILLIIFAIILGVVLHKSIYGRFLLAVGRNEEASRFSGLRTDRIKITAYVIGSLMAAVSAILFAFYTNSVSPSMHGNFYESYAIAAAVLGGCSLRGGEGSVFGVVIGAAIIQVLQNLVILLGIPTSLNFAVMGAVILLGVVADGFYQRASSRVK